MMCVWPFQGRQSWMSDVVKKGQVVGFVKIPIYLGGFADGTGETLKGGTKSKKKGGRKITFGEGTVTVKVMGKCPN